MSTDLFQYLPLTASIVRSLTDKLYEKRKSAALEIEKQIREYVKSNNYADLERTISVLETLTLNSTTNSRKGGLIGLAATAIALGKNSSSYSSKLMEPVFFCFTDSDPRVRYFACESLYNIVKICRTSALTKFGELFDILWKLTSDTDQNVRSGSELLDRLIKEIVVGTPNFDLEFLMVLIRERIYTVNSSNRRFIISWLSTALTVPTFFLNSYIPEVVDGVFKALEDPSQAVRDITISVLTELLYKLDSKSENEVNINAIVNALVAHVNSNNVISREMGIVWLNEICKNYDSRVLPNLSSYFIAILPLIGDVSLRADELNQRLIELVNNNSEIPFDAVVEVLLAHLRHEKTECRVATLNWVRHLHSVQEAKMFNYMDRFFPVFLDLLLDSADEVLMLDIMLISDICGQLKHNLDLKTLNLRHDVSHELKSVSPYLIKFIISLLKLFKNEPRLMAERGVQIIRQICLLLNAADVYRSLAVLLLSFYNCEVISEKKNASSLSNPEIPLDTSQRGLTNDSTDELEFIGKMVAMLNRTLLTTFELFYLRQCLRHPENNGYVDLFEHLFRCWCHQPICLISLCLLSKNYNQAVEIVQRISEIDITVELLTEVDHLVQLIESPIFSYVRMDLLNCDYQKPLSGVLSALLMLLPQTDAFNTLHKRLLAVPNLILLEKKTKTGLISTSTASSQKIKFKDLINYFDKVTSYKNSFIRRNHQKLLDNMAINK